MYKCILRERERERESAAAAAAAAVVAVVAVVAALTHKLVTIPTLVCQCVCSVFFVIYSFHPFFSLWVRVDFHIEHLLPTCLVNLIAIISVQMCVCVCVCVCVREREIFSLSQHYTPHVVAVVEEIARRRTTQGNTSCVI